jgi:hypothetical protein
MSDCLHCDINQLVEQRLEQGATAPGELVSMIVESLVDLIHMVPETDQPNLMAHAMSVFGQLFMEKGGAFDSSSSAAH